jgi:acyl-CoA thioester hydrolase
MEEKGIQMPVIHMDCFYLKSVFYDDLIKVHTYIKELPKSKIKFEYEIYNSENILINKASTTLIFLDTQTGKPSRAPQFFTDKIKDLF